MESLASLLINHKDVDSVLSGINLNLHEQLLTGMSGSARSLFMAGVHEYTGRNTVVITHNQLQAQKLFEDLSSLLPSEQVHLFPVNETIAAELSVASPELRAQRLNVMNYFANGGKGTLVVPLAGIKKLLPTKQEWLAAQTTLSIGSEVNMADLTKTLVSNGYSRNQMVSAPGEFSVRGGIIDIYPLTEDNPFRIELFDTEVDSIRTFSLENQRSLEQLQKAVISPATEILATDTELLALADHLEKRLPRTLEKLSDSDVSEALSRWIGSDISALRDNQRPDHIARYFSLLHHQPAHILNYFSEDTVVFFDEISRIHELDEQLDQDCSDFSLSLLTMGEMLPDISLVHHLPTLLMGARYPFVYFSLFLRHVAHANPQNIVNFSCKPMQNFHGQMNIFKAEVDRWVKAGYTVVLQGVDDERIEKLASVLDDFRLPHTITKQANQLKQGELQIAEGSLNSGFELPMQRLVVITEKELFNQKKRKNFSRQKISNAERIKSYSELKIGDFVVHINHGIGKYIGIETLLVDGIHKDFLHIHYAGDDKLYVPVDQIDCVQKYVGSESKAPKLYKLGGNDWKKVKAKVKASVQDIADELIKLYAARELSKGHAFSLDSQMQNEFETSFPYSETEDQLRSIREIKKDMERTRPMDRLLCGDVGYGKTEVALRAAFKAVNDGKQVAFLVPTTILAQQHYETLRERFQDFPINIGLLSRFRTKKQQTETIKGLKAGTVDIVVGTHRVLSKDILFMDLGLLVVDEEQRFGVKHKERIKQLKTNVDVLTLTATPIPRTLHMSMLGVRDLSVIETPPENRFPIQTYVMEYNPNITREVIERELARSGQVFFLYNRTEDIAKKATEIATLVPEARVAYAHGKMAESELESVIYAFLGGEFDVLVSTTIIETGVDIPNVNTLIVHDADKMGLSQLYQLRGRVGRSNRIAYAYFTYKKDKVLTEVAEKRLQAIKEFTELGSGFKIAMRDLSIRGAGNLLGAEQHGFIDSVGFDMYSHLLSTAIEERKGVASEIEEQTIEIEMEIDAYIPETYIQSSNHKIEMYKLFRAVSTLEELDDLRDELMDRFGDYPDEVDYLLKIAELKIHGALAGVESIKELKKTEMTIILSEEMTGQLDGAKLFEIIQPYGRTIGLGLEKQKIKIVCYTKGIIPENWLTMMINVFRAIPLCKKPEEPARLKM